MDKETAALVKLAKENPWRLFNCGELAQILNVDDSVLSALNRERDCPLVGKKGRPEWVVAWMQDHRGFAGK